MCLFRPKLHNSGKLLLLCLCTCVCVCLFIRFFFFSPSTLSPLLLSKVLFQSTRIFHIVLFFACYFHFMAIVVDFPLNGSNCERTFVGWIGCEVCVSLYICISLCVCVCVCVVVGRHCNRYYYVRYQTISIIGYQNCCRTWWWHCCYCLFSLCVCDCWLCCRHPRSLFSDVQSVTHNSTPKLPICIHTTNIRHFFVRFELICIFVSISHFNFVTLFFLYLSHSCSRLMLLLVWEEKRVRLVFRIWFPLIGAVMAILSALRAFKVFLAC